MPRRQEKLPLLDYELVEYDGKAPTQKRYKRRAPAPPRKPIQVTSRPRPKVDQPVVSGVLLPPPPRYPINRWVQL